jgi:hypothetical protein
MYKSLFTSMAGQYADCNDNIMKKCWTGLIALSEKDFTRCFLLLGRAYIPSAGHVARMEKKRNECRILVGNPEGKRPLGRSRCRWVDNINNHLWEIGWNGMNWIVVAHDTDQWRALVNTVMNLWVPWNAREFLSGCTIGGFSRRDQLREWVYCEQISSAAKPQAGLYQSLNMLLNILDDWHCNLQ